MTATEIADAVRREVEPMSIEEAKSKILECRNSVQFMARRESFTDPAGATARELWNQLHSRAYPEPPTP